MTISSEVRDHLGPHEIEIDSGLYGIMLFAGYGKPLMTNGLFDNKDKALAHAETFGSEAYVVKIGSTNS